MPTPLDPSWSVDAQLQNSRLLLQLLKALHFKDDVNVVLGKNGIKLIVEESKAFQASAFINREAFRFFHLRAEEEEVFFQLSLPSLVDCLGMFGNQSGSSPVLCLKYAEEEPLKLWIEEAGVVVEINARTRVPADLLDFDFSNTDISCKVILQADQLKEVLSDLDLSSEFLDLRVSPPADATDKGVLRISTDGPVGRLDIEIPRESDLVSHFSASRLVTARYPMSLIKHALRPLSIAEKVSVRVNQMDLLCLQYMVKFEDQKSFLEFVCVPEERMT